MASAKKKTLAATFFLLMATTLLGVTLAGGGDVHTVGDSAGWTTFIDYNNWASSRNFHVGDIIVFNYNNQSHNVKQVTLQDFQSCNAESPVATFTTGSNCFSLKRAVHYYFLCGYPGHCEAGQKVDITVTPTSLRPIIVSPISAPSATPLPSSSSSPSSSPSNPDESNAASFKILLFKLWSPMLFFLVLFLHS